MSSDLRALLAASAKGDRIAFRRLFDATAPKLLGVARRIVRDHQAAEDVVQEAFVSIWRSAGSYSAAVGSPMAWLLTVVRNKAIDRARSDASRPVTDIGQAAFEQIPGPGDQEASTAERDALLRCLDRLDEPQRRCFVLAYVEGLSRDELASRFGMPVNTIKTWLHRAAGVLRTCLEAR